MNFCVKKARNNPYADGYRHTAILLKGGKPIGIGFNREKQGYTKDPIYRNKCIHAEFDLLSNLPEHVIEHGILIIGGVTKGGRTNLSKPCATCQKYLKRFDLKAIYFSTVEGSYGELVM